MDIDWIIDIWMGCSKDVRMDGSINEWMDSLMKWFTLHGFVCVCVCVCVRVCVRACVVFARVRARIRACVRVRVCVRVRARIHACVYTLFNVRLDNVG